MSTFTVGQKVRVKSAHLGMYSGLVGTVIHCDPDLNFPYHVKFDEISNWCGFNPSEIMDASEDPEYWMHVIRWKQYFEN